MACKESPGEVTPLEEIAPVIPEERRCTYADYRSWGDERWELLDGHPYAMSSSSSLHQMISMALAVQLFPYFAGKPWRLFSAPMDVKLSEWDVVQPDLLVVCDPEQIRPAFIEGPPRLVIEISSSSTQRHDRVRKMALYAKSGVEEYWLITPHPFMVEVLRNCQGLYLVEKVYTERDVLRSPAFAEVRLDLGQLFAQLPIQPSIDEVRESPPPYQSVTSP